VHRALAEIRAVVDEYPGAVTIAEIEAMSWPDWAEYYGTDLTGMHLPFPFRLLETHWRAEELRAELGGLYAALPPGGWPILALGNHDRARLATRLGPAQARVAAVLLLTLAATPCLLYGDELGLPDQPVPVERQRDYFARTAGGVSRDPTRAPMPWHGGPNAGFSTAHPSALWLPVTPDAARRNVAAQLATPGSTLALYRELLRLRHTREALRRGGFAFLEPACTPATLAYQRYAGDERLLVALNLTDRPVSVPLDQAGRVLLSTVDSATGPRVTGPRLRLAGDEAVVIEIEEERVGHEDH
jgi:glycosidase